MPRHVRCLREGGPSRGLACKPRLRHWPPQRDFTSRGSKVVVLVVVMVVEVVFSNSSTLHVKVSS
ncbi:hypothetical protein E2C01_073036 [Portunus trituberculatus]|uniref:Uncharacterized protein n=1 Tax=Portunus trituberculatus TaxID=210409 RepID=A0A5B7ICA0_PORTR|nr:hypothetical protein [Portunus trituberculatus]